MTGRPAPAPVRAVVLDIEGTTGSADHVHHVLFPYARKRLAAWFADRRGTAEAAAALDSVRAATGRRDLDEAGAVAALRAWSDADVKAAPLKTLQAAIWAAGYADGTLHGHVYDDVPPALTRWTAVGLRCHVYSSGAAAAQRAWFAHSNHGDLTGLLTGYFDLTAAGPKRNPASYRTISRALDLPPVAICFLSDVGAELDAAAAAGWRTIAVRRPDDPRGTDVPGHPVVTDLTGLDFPAPAGSPAAG